jgi:hypothetical protein
MVPLVDQPGATGMYAVTIGALPSFLTLNQTTGVISFSSGTGSLTFNFTVTFTPNGAYTGTVSFIVNAGVIISPAIISGAQVQTITRSFTAAEVIAAGENPVTIAINPDPNKTRFYGHVLSYKWYYKFVTINYLPFSGFNIDWGIFFDNPGATNFNVRDLGSFIDRNGPAKDAFLQFLDYDIFTLISEQTSPVILGQTQDLKIGTPTAVTDKRPISGDGTIKIDIEFIWVDLENLDNFA